MYIRATQKQLTQGPSPSKLEVSRGGFLPVLSWPPWFSGLLPARKELGGLALSFSTPARACEAPRRLPGPRQPRESGHHRREGAPSLQGGEDVKPNPGAGESPGCFNSPPAPLPHTWVSRDNTRGLTYDHAQPPTSRPAHWRPIRTRGTL